MSLPIFGQMEANRFATSEENTEAAVKNEKGGDPQSLDSGGGNPGDPLPINDYVPLLALVAVALIIYKTHPKKNLLS